MTRLSTNPPAFSSWVMDAEDRRYGQYVVLPLCIAMQIHVNAEVLTRPYTEGQIPEQKQGNI